MSLELVLSLIAALCVITLAVAIAAATVAIRKAPPESNEQLAVRVTALAIQVDELLDATERAQRRQAVRDSRARSKESGEIAPSLPDAPFQRTGILRQPLPPGARVIGGRAPTQGV